MEKEITVKCIGNQEFIEEFLSFLEATHIVVKTSPWLTRDVPGEKAIFVRVAPKEAVK